MQYRIFKASKQGNKKLVHILQKRLVYSLNARQLAVLRATGLKKGQRTSGKDGTESTTHAERQKLAETLVFDGKSTRIRRLCVQKPGEKTSRFLGLPTLRDRAKQELAKLALEPEWEAVFEPNSYGFRPGRTAHDAVEALFSNLRVYSKNPRVKHVFQTSFRDCVENIDQTLLLDKVGAFPEMRNQLASWLRAGVLRAPNRAALSETGTLQGGALFPLLVNIAFHGIEEKLKDFVRTQPNPSLSGQGNLSAKEQALGVVRYADEIVLTHPVLETLTKCVEEMRCFVRSLGLEFDEGKTLLRPASEGFTYLGFRLIVIRAMARLQRKKEVFFEEKLKIKISPSKEAKARLLETVRSTLLKMRACSAGVVIRALSPKIIGWCNYYRFCECSLAFKRLDHTIYGMLHHWVNKRSTRLNRTELKNRSFPPGIVYSYAGVRHANNWVFATTGKEAYAFLPYPSWVKKKAWVKVQGQETPFDHNSSEYWIKRLGTLGNKRQNTLFKRQAGVCPWCHGRFGSDSVVEIDHVTPRAMGGADTLGNLQLLHAYCHKEKTQEDRPKIPDFLSKHPKPRRRAAARPGRGDDHPGGDRLSLVKVFAEGPNCFNVDQPSFRGYMRDRKTFS